MSFKKVLFFQKFVDPALIVRLNHGEIECIILFINYDRHCLQFSHLRNMIIYVVMDVIKNVFFKLSQDRQQWISPFTNKLPLPSANLLFRTKINFSLHL